MKQKLKKLILTLFTGILVSSTTFAQQKEITLEEGIQIGLQNSKTLHSSKMKVLSAEANLGAINTLQLPSLSLNASYTRLSPVNPFAVPTPFGVFTISPSILDNYNLKLSLQQPLFTGFKLSSSSKIAEDNSLAAKQQYTQDEQNLILNIKNAYWGLFSAEKLKKAVDDNFLQVKAHLADIQNFFKQGLSTKNDVLKVEVQLSEIELQQIDAKNSVKIAIVNLDNVIGLPLSSDLQIPQNVSVSDNNEYDLTELIKEAIQNRPDLKAMQYQVQASKAGIALAQSNWYPQIYLTGNYYYSKPNQRILPSRNQFDATWDVGIGLSFNIWNWGATKDQTTQAEAQYEQSNDGLKSMKDAITLEVTQDYYNMIKAKEKILVAEQTVSQAEENYRVTDDKFKQGLTLNSELLDAETALLQAKTNQIQSLADYELAVARIQRSIGTK
ncbi:MAG TPA: TolC family protein [Ignavibacteriaceae bacterium]|nr:TolC family protein [Ignavibacteriaceae bacterium]